MMGIGIKDFQSFLNSVLSKQKIQNLSPIIVKPDYYVNKIHGCIVPIPPNWYVASFKRYGKLRNGFQISQSVNPDKETPKSIGEPALILSKYAPNDIKYKDEFSPAINFYILHKDEVMEMYEIEGANNDFKTLAHAIAQNAKKLFKNYKIIKPRTKTKICGYQAYTTKWSWKFESIDSKKSWTCQAWSFLIEKNQYLLALHMIDSIEAGEIETPVFQNFLASIKII